MKRLLSVLFCLVVLFSVTCTVWAEEDTQPQSTTTVGDTEPTTTVSEGDTTTTTKSIRTKMILSYDAGTLLVRVKDGNGRPVRNASVTMIADGVVYTAVTDDMGMAELTFSETPAAVSGVMPEFQGEEFYYRQCSASLVLSNTTTEPTTTEPTTTESTTTESTTATSTYITTARPTASLTSHVLTTTDPDSTTATEAVTTTVTTAEEEKTDNSDVRVPRGLAVGMIIFGAVLLLAAVALVIIYLILTRRTDDRPKEDDATPDVSSAPLTEESAEETAESEPTEQAEPAAGEERVSLEDLFRDR